MQKSTWLLVIAMLFINAVKAQLKPITIKGQLTDKTDKRPLAGARIDLFSATDTTSYHTIADKNGAFSIQAAKADTFRVLVTMTDYPLITNIWIITDSSANQGTIAIAKKINHCA